MRTEITPWESFLETGSIDDYLAYCTDQKSRMFAACSKGASNTDEADDRGDRPEGLQA